jgi:ABC-2 type transport system permease protein
MARVSDQLAVVALLRYQLFLNSLHSVRGRLDLVSRCVAGLLILAAGLGGAFALSLAAYGITVAGHLTWLAIPFWLVFLFWQLFPLMATAFNQTIDTSSLLHFPLSYGAYVAVRLVFGALDIATALGVAWTLGLFTGIAAARVDLLGWELAVTLAFLSFNVLFARMLFVSIEGWLSRRRSREILGFALLLLMIGFQLSGPIVDRYGGQSTPDELLLIQKLLPLERSVPPGLPESILTRAAEHRESAAAMSLAALVLYSGVVFLMLDLRLRARYRGEGPRNGEARRTAPQATAVRAGWKIPGLAGPVSALYEKELYYFSRSGPMLFTLIMPLVVVFFMWAWRKGAFAQQSGFLLPLGAAYCLTLLTNLVYNSFGGDGSGIQFLFFSPVSFRQVALAKNLAQVTVLLVEVSILWLGIVTIYHPPRFRVVALTAAWYLFAVPLNLTLGNLLSVYFPKRIDYSTFGRQRAAPTTILISLGVQLAALAVGAASVLITHQHRGLWGATLILLALAIPALAAYFLLLGRIEQIARKQREVLTSELCRAS